MLIVNKYEIPDSCPKDCPLSWVYCKECPLFVRSDFIYKKIPEKHREDWAKAWSEWFKSGYKTPPELFYF